MSRRNHHRVVITGVGIVSSVGIGNEAVVQSLENMRSGIRIVPERRDLGFRSALSGTIEGFSPRFEQLGRKQRKSMSDFVEWSSDAVFEALSMAGISRHELCDHRCGVVFGNDSVATPSYQQAEIITRKKNTAALHSGMVFRSMNSTITMNLSSLLGTRGASWTLSGACASGGHAVGQAADLIAMGRQDVMICGGAQEISWESVCSFDALCAFSTREEDPEAASRPFDAGRDGLVPSGGAACLILEDRDRAVARGAEILGEVLAYAFSSDGGHIAVPNGDGIARSMDEALRLAGLEPSRIDYLCAHGTSTPVGDAVEAEAIATVFGSARPWVSSTKSQTGHEMWMSGASQVVYSLLAARSGFMPGNLNFREPDDRTACLRIASEPVRQRPEHVLCNAAGFGGTNSTLVIRAGE